MDAIIDFLINYGYWGMLIAAFLAGSILPFSSEAVMFGLLAAGLQPVPLVIYGTIGNVAGSMFNYVIGRMGRLDWIEHYLHVKKKSLDKAERFMAGHGAWIGFFVFIPVFGDANYNSSRINESQHLDLFHEHNNRKITPLHITNLRRKLDILRI